MSFHPVIYKRRRKTNMEQKDKKQIALFRYSVISPLITNPEDYCSNNSFFESAANKSYIDTHGNKRTISSGTIERWYYKYRQKGFDGLLPQRREDLGTSRKLPREIHLKIEELINQYPRLKAVDIYRELIKSEMSEKTCSYDTVNRVYRKIKTKTPDEQIKERLRYECKFSNDVWCADSSVGPYLYTGNERIRLTIIAFIDDATRLITGCKIYDSDNTVNLIATLKTAVATYGKPKVLNMDNGRNYRSNQMSLIAARIGISLHYNPIKTPQSKAKIERFFRTLKEHWLAKINYHNFKSIEEYQASLNDYIREYNNTIHSSLNGKTPIERRNQDANIIKYLPAENIERDFMLEIERKVSFDSVVLIDTKEFQVPYKYSSRKIKIRYSHDYSKAYVINGNDFEEIKLLNKIENSQIKRKSKLTEE